MSTPVVVGIDPSLTGTGIAHEGQVSTIASSPRGTDLAARHGRLADILADIGLVVLGISPHRNQRTPDLVVIEAPSLGQPRQAGTLDRHGLWWFIVDFLAENGIPALDVPPATLKKFATGKGNATKADMRMAVFVRAGRDLRDDNQVDAWWLRELGLHMLGLPTISLPKSHTDALAKLRLTPEETP